MRRISKPGSDPEGYLLTSTDEPAGAQITTTQLAAALVAGLDDLGTSHGLPQLRWHLSAPDAARPRTVLAGMASSADYDDQAAEHAVTAWATALGLEPTIPLLDGTTEYTATSHYGLDLAVWGITDHAAYDREETP